MMLNCACRRTVFAAMAAEIPPAWAAGRRAWGKQPEWMEKDLPHGAEMVPLHFPYGPLVQTAQMGFQAYGR